MTIPWIAFFFIFCFPIYLTQDTLMWYGVPSTILSHGGNSTRGYPVPACWRVLEIAGVHFYRVLARVGNCPCWKGGGGVPSSPKNPCWKGGWVPPPFFWDRGEMGGPSLECLGSCPNIIFRRQLLSMFERLDIQGSVAILNRSRTC